MAKKKPDQHALLKKMAKELAGHATIDDDDALAVLLGKSTNPADVKKVTRSVDTFLGRLDDEDDDEDAWLSEGDSSLVLPYLHDLRERLITEAPWKAHAFDRLIASIGG